MKTIVLFFFIVGIIMLTLGYNKEVLKRKEAEIHTVEYRYMPQNLYELQMNPELGNQTVESNFQQMFEGQNPFFNEDNLKNKKNIIRENNKRRKKAQEKQDNISTFVDILLALIKEKSNSHIQMIEENYYENFKNNIEDLLNNFSIDPIDKKRMLQREYKKELLEHLRSIRNSINTEFPKYKKILRKFLIAK